MDTPARGHTHTYQLPTVTFHPTEHQGEVLMRHHGDNPDQIFIPCAPWQPVKCPTAKSDILNQSVQVGLCNVIQSGGQWVGHAVCVPDIASLFVVGTTYVLYVGGAINAKK